MRQFALGCYLLALLSAWGLSLEEETQTLTEERAGTISGRVFFFGPRMWPHAPVYLFDFDQSVPLRRLIRKASQRFRSLVAEGRDTHDLTAEFDIKVADLVPKLPRTSKVRADKFGTYKFENVAPGKRYYVVALDVGEDGVFLATGLTTVVKPNQQLRFDLHELNLYYAD